MMWSKGTGKTFVMGDIHGAYLALRQCLERSDFDRVNDHLICLGDVCDGWPETKECIDELLGINNLTYILGNHDVCALQWMTTGKADPTWQTQGGDATIKSYSAGLPPQHMRFLRNAKPYFLTTNRLFVHGGIDPEIPLEHQTLDTFLWDRKLARNVLDQLARKAGDKLTPFEEVYVGHTPIGETAPISAGGVWLMDTGAGWSGVLSMMNIETKEVFTSAAVPGLYPKDAGRQSR